MRFWVPGCWILSAVYDDMIAFLVELEVVVADDVLPYLEADFSWEGC